MTTAELAYPIDVTVRQARAAYFGRHGLSAEGYRDAWVDLAVGPVPLAFPNRPARQQAVPLHDLHHVATGYAADWVGEVEISAWELGGGCGRAWAASSSTWRRSASAS